MSRSKRKTNIRGNTTSESEKQDKLLAHRRLRRLVHGRLRPYQITRLGDEVDDDRPLPYVREVSNIWSFAKDGKSRFDVNKYPELMRK